MAWWLSPAAGPPPAGGNLFEEALVEQVLAASLRDAPGASAAAAGAAAEPPAGGVAGWFGPAPAPSATADAGADAGADAELRRALEESARQDGGSAPWAHHAAQLAGGLSEDQALQRALRESCGAEEFYGARRLMGPEGPFYPAGLANSGNSCFWNALLQALFAATPVFRGALFQLAEPAGGAGARADGAGVLGLLRDLFAEMDMGLARAIDAGELYRAVFQRAEEADVSEQAHRLFAVASSGPGSLRAVCQELFSGDLYERQREGGVRRTPLDVCQLDLCVTKPAPLEDLLEEHTRDVHGNIVSRSYRLPPVLWLNLDRFVFDRDAQRGRKRQVRSAFPDVLNAWMLVPPEAEWACGLSECARQRGVLLEALQANRAEVEQRSSGGCCGEGAEEVLLELVQQQEELLAQLVEADRRMAEHGAEQELLYRLEAAIVHRGRVDSGHYYAYARAPVPAATEPSADAEWFCLNDASVSLCSAQEMHRVCEGLGEGGAEPPGSPAQAGGQARAGAPRPPAPPAPCPPCPAEASATGAELLGGQGPPPAGRQGFWGSMTSVFGCMPSCSGQAAPPDADRPQSPPSAAAPPAPSVAAQPAAAQTAADAGQTVGQARGEPAAPAEEESTAARCLVYVRCGASSDGLLTEVRQRVPRELQERIDTKNLELLRLSAERVVEDFARCVRHLTSHEPGEQDEGERPRDALQGALKHAERIRAEGGMPRARAYLLKRCWQEHVAWLPEDLCPTATPPDFRMHYGSAAKRFLLDALITRGQHDVASLIVSSTTGSDAFVPPDVEAWLSARAESA